MSILHTAFFVAAVGCFLFGAYCTRKRSPFASDVNPIFDDRRTRKTVGHFAIFVGFFPLALGIISVWFPPNIVVVDDSPPVKFHKVGSTTNIASPYQFGQYTSLTASSNAPPQTVPRLTPASLAFEIASGDPDAHSSAHLEPIPSSAGQIQPSPAVLLLLEASKLLGKNQFDAAMDKVNAALALEPQNVAAYNMRGNIYAAEKIWDKARKEYETAHQLDPKNGSVEFNLAEIQFMQKMFDAARPGFVGLQQNPETGDLASYKVFLCDLFGGHEDVAGKELDAFNQVGENASYYFANAAWSLYHQKSDDAKSWLTSASHIYPPAKIKIYSASLVELGYLGK
jgi:Tetratricopeptide repeat